MPSITRRSQSTGSITLRRSAKYSPLKSPKEKPSHILRRSPRKHSGSGGSGATVTSSISSPFVSSSPSSVELFKRQSLLSPPSTDVKKDISEIISGNKTTGSTKLSRRNSVCKQTPTKKTPKKRLLADLLELDTNFNEVSSNSNIKKNLQKTLSANNTPFTSPIKKRKPKLKYRPELNTIFNLDSYIKYNHHTNIDDDDDNNDHVNHNVCHNANEDNQKSLCGFNFNRNSPNIKARGANIINIENEEKYEEQEQEKAYFLKYSLNNSKKIVVVSGAGISVAAGIPDFRSSTGLFESLKKESKVSNGKDLFDFNHVYSNREETIKFNKMVCSMHNAIQNSNPTDFHNVLDWFSREERLKRIYTQNIDGLELRFNNLNTESPLSGKKPYPNVIQLHGSINHMSCFKCHKVFDFDPEIFGTSSHLINYNEETGEIEEESKQENDHKIVPLCPKCEEVDNIRLIAGKRSTGVGKLRPRVILYNEFHPDGEQIGDIVSQDISSKPDCLIIAGTTLKIPGVRRMCKEFAKTIHSRNGIVIWINNEVPSQSIQDFLECIDLIVVGDCQNLSKLVL